MGCGRYCMKVWKMELCQMFNILWALIAYFPNCFHFLQNISVRSRLSAKQKVTVSRSVADPVPGSEAFLPPGSGMNFLRIPDPAPFLMKLSSNFLQNLCYYLCNFYETGLLLKLTPETARKRSVYFCCPPFYLVRWILDPKSEIRDPWWKKLM
jgi:hypothetical protein